MAERCRDPECIYDMSHTIQWCGSKPYHTPYREAFDLVTQMGESLVGVRSFSEQVSNPNELGALADELGRHADRAKALANYLHQWRYRDAERLAREERRAREDQQEDTDV